MLATGPSASPASTRSPPSSSPAVASRRRWSRACRSPKRASRSSPTCARSTAGSTRACRWRRRSGPEHIVVHRLRQKVSPSGELTDIPDQVTICTLTADELEAEAAEVGLVPIERLYIDPTDDHVGSTVVVLGEEAVMELRVLSLYPEQMNIYADRGNILFLQRRCEWRGIEFTWQGAGPGESVDPGEHDLFYIGGGQDRDQRVVAADMVETKRAALADGGRRRRRPARRLRRLPAARRELPARRGDPARPRPRRPAHGPRGGPAADRQRRDRDRARRREAPSGRLREPRRPHLPRGRARARSAASSKAMATATMAATASRASGATTWSAPTCTARCCRRTPGSPTT